MVVIVATRQTPAHGSRRASSGCITRDRASSDVSSPESDHQSPRPMSSQSVDNAGLAMRRAIMLQRQNATTEDPDTHFYEHFPHTPPRPPSQPRPKSAKGRPRSGSRPRSSSSHGHHTPESSSPTLPQSPMSFSRYKPLPSISSSRLSTASSCSSNSSHHNDLNMSYNESSDLTHKMTDMSLKRKRNPPPEPTETEPHRIQLAIKMLDGSRYERWFKLSDTIEDILCFAESVTNEGLPDNCEICTNELPKRVFSDLSLTLDDIGLQSRTVLYIQER